ncbi:hypothetical protein FJ417_24635 [Mesorhizobium sp. B3-1-7]|uniref:hypothetical protein n=1 Tax=Mesorhizobium sp. B3-1-7 TaxID=2589894 RepID=UPI001126005A|nr:hypothetical protein [Mesorhizobium sp. B3-1-7]TPI54740.1 hypothetical protein FJ417_24635 [Mesorhizobium sp. B3-1-7]
MEAAGDVVITISANAAAFEAALGKARQQADAFDAAVSAKLSGAGMSAGLAKIAGLIEQTNALLSKMVGAASPAAASLEKVTAATKGAAAALDSLNLAQMETKANFSIIGAQSQQYETALLQVNDANRIGVELEKQKATLTQGAVGALNAQAGAAGKVASATEHAASASRLGATQMMSLAHAGRSAAEGLVLGVPAMQILAQQANHLSYALAGEEGLIAATSKARAAFGAFLGTGTGMIATAGVAAVAGLTAYVLATRNSIQSVDQVLTEHKALIDEIAAAYPEAAKAAKQYEEVASRLPQSVAAADINDKIKENTRTLDDLLGSLSTRMQMLSQEWGLVGSSGQKAFGDLADIAKSGAVDAADKVQAALGRMRLDPALNENVHDLAKSLQDDATAAAKLQDALNVKNDFAGIVDHNKRATQTLFELASGFDGVKASAGGADATIAKLFGDINGGDRFGVTRSQNAFGAQLAGSVQATLGAFQQVDQAIQEARRNQLSSFVDLDNQLRTTTQEADALKQAIASAASGDNVKLFFNDVSGIANANSELQRSVDTVNRLFDAMHSGSATTRTVFEGLDMIRQSLIRDGFGVDAVNKFVDSLVRTRMQLDQDAAGAKQLNAAIQAIRNKTVTITVVTRQVGSGTQSLYDVPNSNGGTSSVGVTRYGGDGSTSGPSITANEVPSSGYGSQGGSGSPGTSTVNVWRFATGGMIHPGDTQQVSFFKSPDETVGIFTPGQMQALASPQSAFTGTQPTQDQDRMWTVQMNIEANTRKTTQILDDIRTATASSASVFSGSSSSGGSSSSNGTTDRSERDAYFMQIFKQYQSNFQAAGVVAGQPIGYGLGNSSSPFQIALKATQAKYGFASGGMIGGDAGDTQKVEFFKNPNEKLIIARPDQFTDARSQPAAANSNAANDRPLIGTLSMPIYLQAGAQVTKDSAAELKRQAVLAIREALRGINGR